MDGMKQWIVMFRDERGNQGVFRCWAADGDHAAEQCRDDNGAATILSSKLYKDVDNEITLTLTVTREQVAMLRCLVYEGLANEIDPVQCDFLNALVDQLEQAEKPEMPRFKVEVTRTSTTYFKNVVVQAMNEDDAILRAEAMAADGRIPAGDTRVVWVSELSPVEEG